MYGKKLAYIVRIKDVVEIPDADRIELVHVLDYTVVVKKGEYKPGELGLYVEVDSILPDGFTPEQKTMYASIKDGSYFKGVEVTKMERKHCLLENGLALFVTTSRKRYKCCNKYSQRRFENENGRNCRDSLSKLVSLEILIRKPIEL